MSRTNWTPPNSFLSNQESRCHIGGVELDLPGIGRRLKAMREKRKMSQRELAETCGLSQSCVSQYERGVITNPTIHTVERFAGALKISRLWLLDEQGDVEEATQIPPEPTPNPAKRYRDLPGWSKLLEDEALKIVPQHRWAIADLRNSEVDEKPAYELNAEWIAYRLKQYAKNTPHDDNVAADIFHERERPERKNNGTSKAHKKRKGPESGAHLTPNKRPER